MSKIQKAAGLLLFCGLFLLCGCGDDDDVVAPPTTGSIMISPHPADLEVPWHLSGLDDHATSGRGAQTLVDMAPGSYTLAWQDTAGYETPSPAIQTQELVAGQTITFIGIYAVIPPLANCAETLGDLMNLFRTIYADTIYAARDIEAYEEILSPNFLFVTDDQGDSYDFDIEMDITTKMFTGQQGIDGIALRAITVDQLQQMDVWQETPPEDEFFGSFPGSQFGDFEVDISFFVAGQHLRFRVQGLARFYAVLETIGSQECYRCLGIIDYFFGATEDYTWTSIKSLFR